jgi:NAD(P)-dependent dehydrogenase (short-subunit alcohol dehydrogenase family)
MEFHLEGKRVIVTAGAAGIGRAIVGALVGAGARVHACDVDEGALARLPREVAGVTTTPCDVADPTAVDRLFAEGAARLGGLDALVNNAGIAGPTAAVDAIEPAEWNRTIAVNLSGQFYCARRAVPLLKAAGGGAIVNISSAAGRFGFPLRSPYAASKWGVVGFSHTLAAELGAYNIRSNAILPGPVAGPRIDRVIAAKARAQNTSVESMRAIYLERTAMRAFVTADDVAGMVLFLISDAGRLVSGQAIGVDAGVVGIQ